MPRCPHRVTTDHAQGITEQKMKKEKRADDRASRRGNSQGRSTARHTVRSYHGSTHNAARPPSDANVPPVNVHGVIVPIGRRPLHVDVGIHLGDREDTPALLPAAPCSRRRPRRARPPRVIPRHRGNFRRCARHGVACPRPPRRLHRAAAARVSHRRQQQRQQEGERRPNQPPPPPARAGRRSRGDGDRRTSGVGSVGHGNDGSSRRVGANGGGGGGRS